MTKNSNIGKKVPSEMLAMPLNEVERVAKRIDVSIGRIEKGYLSIVGDVAILKDSDGAKLLGYKNITELAAERWGMSKSTVYNLLAVNERFCVNYKLTEEAQGLKLTEMLAIIAEEKRALLEDRTEDQTEEQIEDRTENQEENQAESQEENQEENQEEDQAHEVVFNSVSAAVEYLNTLSISAEVEVTIKY